MSNGRDTPKDGIRNGKRFSVSIGQVLVGFALIAGTGTTCTVLKSCVSDQAPLLGIQTVGAAKKAENTNTKEHTAIKGELRSLRKDQRYIGYQLEDVLDVADQSLESRSKSRYDKVKKTRREKWRDRRRREAEIEELEP